MIHRWSVLCKRSVIDSETKQVSLFDVVEKIEASVEVEDMKAFRRIKDGTFLIPIELELVSYITNIDFGKGEKIEMKLAVVTSDGEKIRESLSKFDVPEDSRSMRIIMRIQGMPVRGSDTYFLHVWLKGSAAKDFVSATEIPVEVDLSIQEKKKRPVSKK